MKTTALLLLCFVCTANLCSGQNLVPNCSFEDTAGCPDGLGYINYAEGWYSAERALVSSPDYFFNCEGFTMVPSNTISYQFPATGKAYTGIFTWMTRYFNVQYDIREYIGIRLTSPLVIGQEYFVKFKVSLGVGGQSAFASNKVGLLLSTVRLDTSTPPPINNFAHIYTEQIITDTLNWVSISGRLQADSAYEYICIGNFFTDSATSTSRIINTGSWDSLSYFFIDDVCVAIDSNQCSCNIVNSNLQPQENFFKLYPNPVSNYLTVQFNLMSEYSLIIYDIYGTEVRKIIKLKSDEHIDVKNIPTGFYIIDIMTNQQHFLRKIFVNN